MGSRLLHHLATTALLFACAPLPLHAQQLVTGAVGGVLLDGQDRPIAGATILLLQPQTGFRLQLHTDAQGEFLATGLLPGAVTLQSHADNFHAEQVDNLTVVLGQTARVLLHLRPAAAAQTITVQADGILLPSLADAPVNGTLSPRELLALPLDGRRFQTFALLTPLVNLADTPSDTDVEASGDTSQDATDAAVSIDNARLTVRGLDPSQNSATQDGLGNVRAYDGEPRGGALVPFTVPLEAVQDFQVRSLGTGIPQGRDAGGSVDAVTLRGTEALHGSAFLAVRNSGVGAADPFAVATRYNNGAPTSVPIKPRDQREQFGGSLGRVIPGTGRHLFAFAAGEGQRRSFPGYSSPTNANFFTLTPTQSSLLGNRGVSPADSKAALNFLDSLAGEVPRNADEIALFPRLDFERGARSTASVTYTRVRFNAPAGIREQTVIPRARDNFGTLGTHTDSLTARYTQQLSTRWLNELSLQASRDAAFVQQPTPLAQEPHTAPGNLVPQITIDLANSSTGGAFVFGTPASLSKRRLPSEKRAEAYESVTFSGRAHTLTLGAGGSLLDTSVDTGIATNGAYQYGSGTTNGRAGGLVDFITDFTYNSSAYPNGGCPSIYATIHLFCFQTFTQSYGSATTVRFHTGEGSAYFRDAWRLTPHLRVDAGARYEYFRMPLPQHTNGTLDAVFGSTAATNFLPGDPGNLAPHLAIAYAPAERTVVRLAYGIHFGRVTGRTLQQVLQNTALPSSTYSLHLNPRTEVDPSCASSGTNFGYPSTYACIPSGALTTTSNASVLSRRFQLPMLQDAELTLEHSFHHGITLTSTCALTLERELPNTVDLNIAPSNSRAAFQIVRPANSTGMRSLPGTEDGYIFNVPLYTARISPLFGPVTAVVSNGTGTDHAGVLQLTRTSEHGLTLRVSYTFSKAVDSVRHTGSSIDQDAQFDPYDITFDKAPSNYDRQQKVTATAVYTSLVHSESHLARGLANNWSVAPIVFATTGRPYSYLIEGGAFLPGGRTSINGSGGATYLPTVGRNTLRLPWTQTTDLRLMRTLNLHEQTKLSLSAEAFNLLNHRNSTNVQQRAFLTGTTTNNITQLLFQDSPTIAAEGLTTNPFATPTSSATLLTRQRRLQFTLRVDF